MDEKKISSLWLLILAGAIVLASHTQVTLRHIALRIAGVRFGEVEYVARQSEYNETNPRFDKRRLLSDGLSGTVVHDDMSVYADGELTGQWIWFGDEHYEVLDNTATHILVDCDYDKLLNVVDSESSYFTGFRKKTGVVKLALVVPGVNFTVADCLLVFGLVMLTVVLLVQRQKPAQWVPPLPLMALLVVCIFSLVDRLRILDQTGLSVDRGKGIKELIQYVEMAAAWLFFRHVLAEKRFRRWFAWLLATGAAAVILVGLAEYVAIVSGRTLRGLLDINELDSILGFQFNPSRYNTTGSESSRNVLAVYLAMAVPCLFGLGLAWKSRLLRTAMIVLAGLGLCLCLSAPILVCTVAGCLTVACLLKSKHALPFTFAGIFIVLLVMCTVQKHHGRILLDTSAIHRVTDEYGLQPMPVKGLGVTTYEGWDSWQQKYVERQAAMSAIGFSPLLGLGLGNYQAKINMFYSTPYLDGHAIEKSSINFMEKDAHGLYQVQAVETGLLGVGCLLWFLISIFRQAVVAGRDAGERDRALLIAVAGSIMALIMVCWYGSFMVRGLQFIAMAMLALPESVKGKEAGIS
ncbi:MAG: hypothetical protein KAH23_00755 [Kiritimatiellae bacterium]|nr:hypothetical protein [Kiritimatiellia bacterium]